MVQKPWLQDDATIANPYYGIEHADLRQLPVNLPFTRHTLANGLDVLLHEDHDCPIVAVNLWYHVGSKNERPGHTGFAHLFEHLMFEGSQHHDHGFFPAAAGRRRHAQRIDQRRSHELLGSGADRRARARAVDGIGPHGLSAAGADRGQVLEPARRGAERAPAELREPPLRPGADGDAGGAVSARSSVPLDHDRRGRRPEGGPARRGARVLPRATTIRPMPRSRSPATSIPTSALALGRSLLRRDRARRAGRAGARRRVAVERRADPVRGSRRAAAALPRVAVAGDVRRGRRRSRSGDRPARQRQDLAALSPAGVRGADRDRRLGVAELARDGGLRADGGHRRARPHAGRARARDPRGDRPARRRRPDRRGDRARPRAGRGAVRVPAADGRRLRRQVRSAERLQRLPRRPGVLRPRSRSATRSCTQGVAAGGRSAAISTRRGA